MKFRWVRNFEPNIMYDHTQTHTRPHTQFTDAERSFGNLLFSPLPPPGGDGNLKKIVVYLREFGF